MLTTRRTLLSAALAGGALAVAGCGQSAPKPAPGQPPSSPAAGATIGLTYIPNIQFAPFYVAQAEGLLKESGAVLRHHGAQEGLFSALMSDQEQFVIAGGDEVVQAAATGMDLVAVGQYYRQYPVVLIVPEPSPIRTFADLAGHSVGLPGRFGESWFGLQAGLKLAGLTESDVKIEEVGYTLQAALTSSKVESVIGFSNNDLVAFGRAGVPVRAVPLSTSPVPLVSIVLVTRRGTVESKPELVRSVASAMISGIEKTVADSAVALDSAREHIPTLDADMEAAKATLEATKPLWTDESGKVSGKLDPAAWVAMCQFMLDQGIIDKAVDANTVMSNEFVTV